MLEENGIILWTLIVIALSAILVAFAFYKKNQKLKLLAGLENQADGLRSGLLEDLAVPYAVLMSDGKVMWHNTSFGKVFGDEEVAGKYLSSFISELHRGIFPKEMSDRIELEVEHLGKIYEVTLMKIAAQDSLVAITMEDVTKLHRYMEENDNQKLVSGLIYFDNYEEVMESVEEVRQSLLIALVDRKVSQYLAHFDGLMKKMEKDKYFFVVRKKQFREMAKGKFAILEEAKSINIGNTMPVTLSMGMGLTSGTYAQAYSYARAAIDLALARGGDQAVVKNGKEITYFGGKREQTSKNTRVKARVKAEALRELMSTKDQMIVMGHRIADVDSFGAAVGIYRMAVTMEKKAYIVLNEITSSVRPFYEAFKENPKYPSDMFIKSSDVPGLINENTMAVVVDTNNQELVDCPELLKKSKTIVVFDHHRQNNNAIENTVLSYIEPYASSACEMVAEMLQYVADDVKIKKIEANSMYAGIMIDTNNFMNRTGVRTFEAAAFLKRSGADITYVRKVFRDELSWYREKSKIVSSAEIYRQEYAIASFENEHVDSPTIIGAQAANELLNIKGIKASFVLTEYRGKIYVSARAIDEVNVQIIMERLGGGGHINTAGTQFQHTDMDEAIKALKETIDTMTEKGDI